jgi:hypothetical protein
MHQHNIFFLPARIDRFGGIGPHLQRLLFGKEDKVLPIIPFPLPPSNGQHATYNTYSTLTNTIAHFPPLCKPSPRLKKWAIRTLSLNHTYAVARHILGNAPVHGGSADHPLHLHTPAKPFTPYCILLHLMVFLLLLMFTTLADHEVLIYSVKLSYVNY